MGFNEMWGAIGSRFAEAGIVSGLLPYRSASKTLSLTKGIVRMPIAVQNYHVRTPEFVIGALVANTEVTIDTTSVSNGYYGVYAHPTVDADGLTTGVEVKLGGIIQKADAHTTAATTLAQALVGYEPGAANGASVTTVPEPNPDVSAFKMVMAVPASDFYKGRSVLLGIIKVDTGDITEIDISKAHRVI